MTKKKNTAWETFDSDMKVLFFFPSLLITVIEPVFQPISADAIWNDIFLIIFYVTFLTLTIFFSSKGTYADFNAWNEAKRE